MTTLEHRIAHQLPPYVAQQVNFRTKTLGAHCEIDHAHAAAPYAVSEARNVETDALKRELSDVQYRFSRGEATQADVQRVEEKLTQGHIVTAIALAGADDIIQRAADSESVFQSVTSCLNRLPWPTVRKSLVDEDNDGEPRLLDIEIERVKLDEGTALETIIATQQAIVAAAKGGLEELPTIPERKDTGRRRERVAIQTLAAKGQPDVHFVDRFDGEGNLLHVEAKVIWPHVTVNAPGLGVGAIPRVHDALALAAWANQDRIISAVEEAIERAYEGVEIQMDPHEKQRRRRELKAEILAAERIEAAAIWGLIERGDQNIRFRPDIDPRAVLGISA